MNRRPDAGARASRARRGALLAVAVLLCPQLAVGTASAQEVPPVPTVDSGCLPPPAMVEESVPWAQRRMLPRRVWELTRGEGVTVAVIDSGVDGAVPQLEGVVLPGVDLVNGGGGSADDDCYGHGTFVAGIIAAQPAEGTGFAGIAPGARILPLRNANSQNDGSAPVMAQAIHRAVDEGAGVINISASTTYPNEELRAAVERATTSDVLVVASAANNAQEGNPTSYPAAYPGVLAVGAIDAQGERGEFSQTGEFVSLVAPGVDVVSLGPGGPGHWQGSGTSYAAPFVSGVAALVRSRYPELTASQVAHRLRVTADPPPAERPDPALGWGVVNPYAAVTAVVPSELEEQPSPARQPTISHPVIPEDDPIPRIVATLTVASAAVLAFVGVLAGVFGPPGWRRRWRRSRVAVVAGADEAGANSSVEPPGGPAGGPSDPDGGDQPDGAVREGNPRAVTPAGGAVGRRGRPPAAEVP
ncbi:type VII secretion-associated serine protease mycosin [Actinoalloteichus caeruleus]|uniref:type VII secretion-associated serine protease mycosin n=1 Tax=Actinoalloteichus cyanogriseus TaxID=2893586 RepID=UPI000A5F942D|nr:type VII secretion-associated serine protease mycosin [Actinoalloteichus caeruleus]